MHLILIIIARFNPASPSFGRHQSSDPPEPGKLEKSSLHLYISIFSHFHRHGQGFKTKAALGQGLDLTRRMK